MSDPTIPTTSGCRALVRVGPIAGAACGIRPVVRPSPAFMAHLIATAAQVPQTRARRRAGPEEVTNRYRAALAKAPTAPGRALAVTVK